MSLARAGPPVIETNDPSVWDKADTRDNIRELPVVLQSSDDEQQIINTNNDKPHPSLDITAMGETKTKLLKSSK